MQLEPRTYVQTRELDYFEKSIVIVRGQESHVEVIEINFPAYTKHNTYIW